uniref:Phosphoprotein n=1 Tax=Shelduck rhabdovirus TaxID=2212784 RepID=A0A3G1RPN2_9RHAB|nr:MAG: phosphoprotein [Shelduck rhabdovirus]
MKINQVNLQQSCQLAQAVHCLPLTFKMDQQLDNAFLRDIQKIEDKFVEVHQIDETVDGEATVTDARDLTDRPPTRSMTHIGTLLREMYKGPSEAQRAPEAELVEQIETESAADSPYQMSEATEQPGEEEQPVLTRGATVMPLEVETAEGKAQQVIRMLKNRGIETVILGSGGEIIVPEDSQLTKSKIKEEVLKCCLEMLNLKLEIRTTPTTGGGWDEVIAILDKGYRLMNPANRKTMIVKLDDSPNLARFRQEEVPIPRPRDLNTAILELLKLTDLYYEVSYRLDFPL